MIVQTNNIFIYFCSPFSFSLELNKEKLEAKVLFLIILLKLAKSFYKNLNKIST